MMVIVIVEDRSGQAMLIQKIILKDSYHQVMIAKDAFDAYVLLKALDNVDVVILDNELPYVNGIDFLQKIKSHPDFKDIPVVMSTADEEYESFLGVGADYCLHKPYSRKSIVDVLAEIKG